MLKPITLVTFLIYISTYGQDITGQWNGILSARGIKLRVVFNIAKTEGAYSATMDSPDQGAKGIPVTTTSFENSVLKLFIQNLGVEYEGKASDSIITGTFKQAGQSFPMNLSRQEFEKEKIVRTQEPVKPYPYYSEDITFINKKAGITLAGTLTLPKTEGNYPAVILISGSGPQNRNEEVAGHKPFLVLADHLTKHGIAVLRFDDRGVGDSGGDFSTATSLDFAKDVEAAVTYLETRPEINKTKIGLIGHSEGGIIAPMVAATLKNIYCIILLAAPGIPGNELLLLQQERIGAASGINDTILKKSITLNKGIFDIIMKSTNQEKLKTEVTDYLKQKSPAGTHQEINQEKLNSQINQLTNPWMQYFMKHNPAKNLQKVKCPVLAINGEKDLQVPAKENLDAIRKALAKSGNKNSTLKELPNLNHLFQECNTGLPNEYGTIEQTFSPVALHLVTDWISRQLLK
jgi:pimeloyl-ACP methyl ester carboxylesterase